MEHPAPLVHERVMPETGARHKRAIAAVCVRTATQGGVTNPTCGEHARAVPSWSQGNTQALAQCDEYGGIRQLEDALGERVEQGSPRSPATVAVKRGRSLRMSASQPPRACSAQKRPGRGSSV